MQRFAITPPGAAHVPHGRPWRGRFSSEGSKLIHARLPALLLAALLLLAAACTDQIVTTPQEAAPQEALFSTSGEAVNYRAILLEDTRNSQSLAFDINDAGVVAGMVDGDAVRWIVSIDGVTGPEKLGTLSDPYTRTHWPIAVNAGGTIVGWADRADHIGRTGAFIYTDEMGMQLLPQVEDTYRSRALAINDQGIAVGTIEFAGEEAEVIRRGAVWLNATDEPILLPPLDGYSGSSATVVNNEGLIGGASDGRTVTWRISDTGELLEGPVPLEAGFRILSARLGGRVYGAMNNQGDIAGSQEQDDNLVAALMRDGVVTLLGSRLPDEWSEGSGINDSAANGIVQIVGSSGSWAMLWTVDAGGNVNGPVDIGAPSRSTDANAFQINGQGWIVGRSANRTSSHRATLWLPEESDDTCKPHPRTGECR